MNTAIWFVAIWVSFSCGFAVGVFWAGTWIRRRSAGTIQLRPGSWL